MTELEFNFINFTKRQKGMNKAINVKYFSLDSKYYYFEASMEFNFDIYFDFDFNLIRLIFFELPIFI
jgi:hypothetical protein